jgi:hypothetical protein
MFFFAPVTTNVMILFCSRCNGHAFTYDSRTCIHDDMEMLRNLFVDSLVHEKNGYKIFLPVDIKHYLSRVSQKGLYNRVCKHVTPCFP